MRNQKKKVIGSLALASLMLTAAGALTVANSEYASAEVSANALQMVKGASIRLAQDKNGLRFKTEIGAELYNFIMNREAGKDVRVGAFIVPAAYVENQNAYKEGATIGEYDKFKQSKEVVFYDSTNAEIENKIYQDGNNYYTNAVLTNVKYENLGKEFVGIGYVQWTTAQGSSYQFVDLGATDVVRSAAYVASAHYENETDSAKLELVKQYAYGALFAKTEVVRYDETNKQYIVYDANTYTKVDDVMTAIDGALEISLDKTTLEADVQSTVDVAASMKLTYNNGENTATVDGIKYAIACVSSNPDVVKVEEDGTVKAVSGGQATLTYSCMDKTATCEVTVIQRKKSTLVLTDLDLSKDSAAVIKVAEGEVASKVLLGETDITSYVTPTAGKVSIAKEAFASAPKGDNQLTIFTSHYEYDAYVCKADYVISDYSELLAFRTAARGVSDQLDAITSAGTSCDMLTYSDTWDWYVVLDADITCTGSITQLASYFGLFDGRGHKISNLTIEESTKWQYNGFFDNRIANGETGVTDSKGVMHEGVGLRVKNLALINMGSSNTRCGFTTTATNGASYSNIYMESTIGLVSMCKYMNDGANVPVGNFGNVVLGSYTPTYFPWPSGINYDYQGTQNIYSASRIHINRASLSLRGYEIAAYADATAFYNGVKTAITGSDSWNKNVWKVAANGDITFGGNVIIAAPQA